MGPVRGPFLFRTKNMTQNGNKILVGLSGGVDSAVSAYLLKEAGYDVHAGFMVNFQSDDDNCTTRIDLEEAERVAKHLGIPLSTFDFVAEYEDRIIRRIYEGYEKGITPNPDVLCNNLVKFDLFLEEALSYGFDGIATGHYARIDRSEGFPRLLKGVDPEKDQTYFLSRLERWQLEKAHFPVGGIPKSEVREIARKAGLPNAERKDSQGLCFIGKIPMREFLRERLPERTGDIVDTSGKKLGEHPGAWFYTVGQRRDIRVGGGEALFVIRKDVANNRIVVGTAEERDLFSNRLLLSEWKWLRQDRSFPWKGQAKIRYRQQDQEAEVALSDRNDPNSPLEAVFESAQRAISPGQFFVAYEGDELVGSAVIVE